MPPAAVRHGRTRQSSGTGPSIEGYCGNRSRGVSIRGKSFYRETWGTRLGDRKLVERGSDPRVAYPEVKVQVPDLVGVVGIIAPFAALGVGTCGTFV